MIGAILLLSVIVFLGTSVSGMFQFLQNWVTIFDDTSIQSNISGYVDEDIYNMRQSEASGRNWYVKLSSDLVLYFFLIVTALDFMGLSKIRDTGLTKRMFPIILLFFALAILAFNLGSIARFKNVFYLLVLARYIIIFNHYPRSYYLRTASFVLIPIFTLYIIVSLRTGFYSVDPMLLVGNAISVLFSQPTESLSEFLVGH